MSDFVQNPPGIYITIGIGISLILLVFIPDMIGKKKDAEAIQEAAAMQAELETTAEENARLKAEIERLMSETTDHFLSEEMSPLFSVKEEGKSE